MAESAPAATGRRPHTVAPEGFWELDEEYFAAMSDAQLLEWADTYLSIPLPADTPRTVALTRIFNAAVVVTDA